MPVTGTAATGTPTFSGQLGQHLRSPAGLDLAESGRELWVADTFAGRVHRYDLHDRRGRRRSVIGEGVLVEPRDVAADDKHVYVVDSERESIEVFDPTGRHRARIGRGMLVRPRGIALEPSGTLLVSDVGNNRVARFDPRSGDLVAAITTGVHIPHGLAVDATGFWLVSSSRQYDGDCGVTRFVGDAPTVTLGDGQHSTFGALSNPAHVAVAGDGSVLVSVPDYGFVSRFRTDGTFVEEFGTDGPGLLRQPLGLAVTPRGQVLVADSGNGRIARFGGLA